MIIPVRCISCGKPVGHLWEEFLAKTKKGEKAKDLLDKMGLVRYCCRNTLLTHVDTIDEVARFKA